MDNLTETVCLIGDFCRAFEPEWERRQLADGRKKRQRAASWCLSELMMLTVLFHQLRFRQFKSEDTRQSGLLIAVGCARAPIPSQKCWCAVVNAI